MGGGGGRVDVMDWPLTNECRNIIRKRTTKTGLTTRNNVKFCSHAVCLQQCNSCKCLISSQNEMNGMQKSGALV